MKYTPISCLPFPVRKNHVHIQKIRLDERRQSGQCQVIGLLRRVCQREPRLAASSGQHEVRLPAERAASPGDLPQLPSV